MFQSFVIMLREGIEAALVIGIMMVALKRMERRDLERSVFWGVGLAILASIGAALALKLLPVNEEAYEGTLYWVSAIFVATMIWWVHRKSRSFRAGIEGRVKRAIESNVSERNMKEIWGLGAFAFLMVFREGAEAVLFLSAVNLSTSALLSFMGSLLGLAAAVIFCVMFIRGSLKVDLQRFFFVTEWLLGIFVAQLFINGYHEFAEAGIAPATQGSMALIGPVVRNNSLFIMALIALPLLVWLSGPRKEEKMAGETSSAAGEISSAERRLLLAQSQRERKYRFAAVSSTLVALLVVGIAYARDLVPKNVPLPESVSVNGETVAVPLQRLEDGNLHCFGFLAEGKMVRFLAMKASDGKYRTGVDACEICGTSGYFQDGENLLCLNCEAEINPLTLGVGGGCNPVPLKSIVSSRSLQVPTRDLEKEAWRFREVSGAEASCPVCGMKVRVSEAAGFESYQGRLYYFCKMGKCQSAFKENPAIFLK